MYTSTSRTAEKASNLHTKKYFDMEEICKNGIMQAKQLDKLHDKQVRTQTGALPALPHQKREGEREMGEMQYVYQQGTVTDFTDYLTVTQRANNA